MPASHTTLPELNDALISKIAELCPALRSVHAFARVMANMPLPCAIVHYTDVLPSSGHGELGTEQFAARVAFSVYVLSPPTPAATARFTSFGLSTQLAAQLNRARLAVPTAPVLTKGVFQDLIAADGYDARGANSAGFLDVWRIDCEIEAIFLPSIWDWPNEDVETEFDGEPTHEDQLPTSPQP
jgi:hypothetical protein